jgi:hypothetical protein
MKAVNDTNQKKGNRTVKKRVVNVKRKLCIQFLNYLRETIGAKTLFYESHNQILYRDYNSPLKWSLLVIQSSFAESQQNNMFLQHQKCASDGRNLANTSLQLYFPR